MPTLSRFALLLSASVCLIPFQAAGETPTSAPLAQSLRGEAKAAYESARLLFEDSDFPGALTKFKRAHDISKDARLLWNMAVCEKELRHYARAAALVSRYLKQGGSLIKPEQRNSAVETQAALRAFYSTVKLRGAPDGATVQVDRVTVGQTPLAEPLLLDLGPRVLRVALPGKEPFETTVDVSGSNEIEVPIELQELAAASAQPARLSVTSSGDRDTVAIDGKVRASQHWEGTLSAGEHTVRVTAAHKKTYEAQFKLLAGSTRELHVTLEDEGSGSGLWYWIGGSAVVAAGAVVGGYFLLKPKPEPGTHPQGSLTTIFLPTSAMRGQQR